MNAPIQDLLIRIKNAYLARRKLVTGVIYSRMKENICVLLKQYKFIASFEKRIEGNKSFLDIVLYAVKDPIKDIPVIKLVSKPSRRWYVGYKDLKPVASWKGIGIISTSMGILPTHVAKKQKIWWELLAEIY